MYKTAYLYTKSLIYYLALIVLQSIIMLYIFTKDIIASITITLIVFSIIAINYYIFQGKLILTDEGIKRGAHLYSWDEVEHVYVYPNEYIILHLKLPSGIHRVGAGIRVRYSDIAEYIIRYDKELIDIFKNKTNGKVQIKNMPYYSFSSIINCLKDIKIIKP